MDTSNGLWIDLMINDKVAFYMLLLDMNLEEADRLKRAVDIDWQKYGEQLRKRSRLK